MKSIKKIEFPCFAEISCRVPPNGNNTEIPETQLLYQEVYIYRCLTGYTTSENIETECLASGVFTLQTAPNCESKKYIVVFNFFILVYFMQTYHKVG